MSWIERVKEEIESNEKFLEKFTIDEILEMVKDYAIRALPFVNEPDETIIAEAGSYKVEYTNGKFHKLKLWLPLSKGDYNVEINTLELNISTSCRSPETVCKTPVIMLYKFNK